ncbi:hypothetical protein K3495_g13039 [Podosphaera aphanis]|nr:hypothetical protein K3495_g13039 [Podosphaera aphanis]
MPFVFYRSLTPELSRNAFLQTVCAVLRRPTSEGKKPSQSETTLCAKNTLGIETSQPQVSKWSSDRVKHLAAPQEKSLTTYTPTPSVEVKETCTTLSLLYTLG